jgi:hypothetical protein
VQIPVAVVSLPSRRAPAQDSALLLLRHQYFNRNAQPFRGGFTTFERHDLQWRLIGPKDVDSVSNIKRGL